MQVRSGPQPVFWQSLGSLTPWQPYDAVRPLTTRPHVWPCWHWMVAQVAGVAEPEGAAEDVVVEAADEAEDGAALEALPAGTQLAVGHMTPVGV